MSLPHHVRGKYVNLEKIIHNVLDAKEKYNVSIEYSEGDEYY